MLDASLGWEYELAGSTPDACNQCLFVCVDCSACCSRCCVWRLYAGCERLKAAGLLQTALPLVFHAGIGTFYPLYYTLTQRGQSAMEAAQQQRQRGPGVRARQYPALAGIMLIAIVILWSRHVWGGGHPTVTQSKAVWSPCACVQPNHREGRRTSQSCTMHVYTLCT